MKNLRDMVFEVDKVNCKVLVERYFEASLPLVWSAWTEPEILDQWWAPEPYINETKFMDFREGGHWLYSMRGPEGDKHWCRADYHKIVKHDYYKASDDFCDENGVPLQTMPSAKWTNKFIAEGEETKVAIEIKYDNLDDLEKIISLGFKEGFSMGLSNLDRYLASAFQLRKENKTNNQSRVCMYLNFPGNTEEAMKFYQHVFNGKFVGKGLQRFSDVVLPPEAAGMPEETKKMILHAELEIIPGFVLMATDAPESMGFKMVHGNNMHINVELDSRAETERIYEALSEGGNVTMPLKDMFFGAYFAELKDKYGINWMLTHQNA